jgi:Lamin Tail Domain
MSDAAAPSPAAEKPSGAKKVWGWAAAGFDWLVKAGGLAGVWLTVAALFQIWPFSGLPDVRIDVAASRVNSPGNDSAAAEYICLVNKGKGVDLLGWTVRDAEGDVNVLPDIVLLPDQSIRVHPGRGTNSETDVYGDEGTSQWNNTADTITFFDDSGNEIDSRAYGQSSESTPADCGTP